MPSNGTALERETSFYTQIIQNPFGADCGQNTPRWALCSVDVQKRFDVVSKQLFKKHKNVRKGRFTLVDVVAVLDAKGSKNALVIIRAIGNKKAKTKAFMTGGLYEKARSSKATFCQGWRW